MWFLGLLDFIFVKDKTMPIGYFLVVIGIFAFYAIKKEIINPVRELKKEAEEIKKMAQESGLEEKHGPYVLFGQLNEKQKKTALEFLKNLVNKN